MASSPRTLTAVGDFCFIGDDGDSTSSQIEAMGKDVIFLLLSLLYHLTREVTMEPMLLHVIVFDHEAIEYVSDGGVHGGGS